MSKFFGEVKGLVWTLAGTALVLITLSGQTQFYGIIISVVGLAIHGLAVLMDPEE